MGEKERKRVLADLSCKVPDTRFMYVTPEQCATPTFQGQNSIDLFIKYLFIVNHLLYTSNCYILFSR